MYKNNLFKALIIVLMLGNAYSIFAGKKQCTTSQLTGAKTQHCERTNRKGCTIESTKILSGPHAGEKMTVKYCPPPKK